MKIDLSVKVDKKWMEALEAGQSTGADKKMAEAVGVPRTVDIVEKIGHIGTHFDAMSKEFSIEKSITKGRIFDISCLTNSEVRISDLNLSDVQPNDFVMFYSGILKRCGYGTKEYYLSSIVELSDELIDELIKRNVSLIGVDMAAAKGPQDHTRIDQYCADKGVFIIENLNNLDLLYENTKGNPFDVYILPLNMIGFSGVPCRIVAQV